MQATHLAAGVLVVVSLLGAASAPAAIAHRDVDNASRIVVSDDPDPRAGDLPPFVPVGPSADRPDGPSLADAATMRDIYYDSSSPQFRFGAANRTLQDHRRARLDAIEQNRTTSRWPAHAPEPRDGVVIEDAYVSFMGATGARLTMATNTSAGGPNATSGPYLLPRDGQVYSLLDYRIGTPGPTCDDLGDRRRCVVYEVVNRTVVRRLSIGAQTWTARGREHRAIDYANATARDETTLRLSATITVTVDRVTRVVDDASGDVLRTTRTRRTSNLTVEDSRNVAVTTNQPLDVTQRIITTTAGERVVVLAFDGPRDPATRRLWSTATLGNTTVRNVWGVYSRRRSTTATIATGDDRRPYDLPHVLAANLTARSATPALRRADGALADGRYPEVARTASVPVTDRPARLGAHVNLSTAAIRVPTAVVVANPPGRVTRVADVHGDPIPVTTRTFEERPTNLTVERLNESHARLRLRDERTGRPLPNRTVALQNAARETVVTDATGTAVVERTGSHLRATFPGTDWTADRPQYYAPDAAAATFPTPFSIYDALASIAGAFVSVVGFVVLYVPLRIVFGR